MTDNTIPNKENTLLSQFKEAVKTKKANNQPFDKASKLVCDINDEIQNAANATRPIGHTDVQHVDHHVDVRSKPHASKLK